jgi:hypothetical protein
MGGEKAFAFAEYLGLATKPLRRYCKAMRMPMIFDLHRISDGFRRKPLCIKTFGYVGSKGTDGTRHSCGRA